MNRKGEAKANFLNEHGPIEMPWFIEQRKQLLEAGVQQRMMEEMKEISGGLFYRMEHEEYGDAAASIIVSREGKLVAEDLEHGFDAGAMEAIGEYFSERE